MDKLRIPRTLTSTAVSALGALLMVGAITFGATVIRPMSANLAAGESAAAQLDAETGSTAGNGGGAQDAPDKPDLPANDAQGDTLEGTEGADDNAPYHEAEATPKPEATDEPVDKPDEPQPTDKPQPEPMHLEAFFNADLGKVVVKWVPYEGDFEKYKLVRTIDGDPTWPTAGEDELVGVIGPDELTKFIDASAPCNVELHYRVFAVVHGADGYIVKAASNAGGVFHECVEPTEPPAEPVALGFEVFAGEAGNVLHWEACSMDGFAVYKVVRSMTDPEPIYPLHDGDELLAAIGDKGVTAFTDTQVEAGQTWTYRVLCLGEGPDGWLVLGLTAPISITVQ